jgi:hypothetical protein
MFNYQNRGISTLVAIGIIAVLVVVVGGGVFGYQYISSQKNNNQQTQNKNVDYFNINSVGLKFEAPKNIKDLVYFVNNISGGKEIDFSMQTLIDQNNVHYEQNCGIDYNPMGAIQVLQKDPLVSSAEYLIKSNNFYVIYIKPNGKCPVITKEQVESLLIGLKTITKAEPEEIKNIVWKTYTNADYGFELKYPQNFKATADVNPAKILNLSLGYANSVYLGDIMISVQKNYNNETPTQYFSRQKANNIAGFESKCQTCANMDQEAEFNDCLLNRPGIIKIQGKDGFYCPNTFRPIFVFNGGYIYEFFAYDKSNPSYDIYQGVLSTFKFTK